MATVRRGSSATSIVATISWLGCLGVTLLLPAAAAELVVTPRWVGATTGSMVSIEVSVATAGVAMGSYGAALRWNADVLTLLDYSGGSPPFDRPTVNTAAASEGVLVFADASPEGVPGQVVVLRASFLASGEPSATTPVEVEVTSLFDSESFADLTEQTATLDAGVCITDYDLDLRADTIDGLATVLSWQALPDALGYDVIRGEVDWLDLAAGQSLLGPVDCIEADSQDTTTGPGTEEAHLDAAIPPDGAAFFYLVRPRFSGGPSIYGFALANGPVSPDCSAARTVTMGDCPASAGSN